MNQVILWLLIICAIGLSSTAAYYSIIGLSTIFIGIVVPVTIMAIFIESSKVLIATVLHQYWTQLNILLKGGLITALIISMGITSIGIYGLLNSGYNVTAIKIETISQQTNFYNNKIDIFQNQLQGLNKEKLSAENNIIQLTEGLSNNKIQYTDSKGNLVISQSNSNRKTLETQINKVQDKKEVIDIKINALNDSINNYNLLNLQLNTNSDLAAEIGPLKYLSKLFNTSIDRVINWFIIALMLVFDPLAIMLILTISSITKSDLPVKIKKAEDLIVISNNRDSWDVKQFIVYLDNINETNKYQTEHGYRIPLLVLSDLGFNKPELYKIIHNTSPNNGSIIIEEIMCTIEKQ
jgi:hypothetical protein